MRRIFLLLALFAVFTSSSNAQKANAADCTNLDKVQTAHDLVILKRQIPYNFEQLALQSQHQLGQNYSGDPHLKVGVVFAINDEKMLSDFKYSAYSGNSKIDQLAWVAVFHATSFAKPGCYRITLSFVPPQEILKVSAGDTQKATMTKGQPEKQSGEPDFRKFIGEVEKRIKSNWKPSLEDKKKRGVATFRILRDGRLSSLILAPATGSPTADAAIFRAIRSSAPFQIDFPIGYRGNDVKVQYIFDYPASSIQKL